MDWHAKPSDEVLKHFNVDADRGLTVQKAKEHEAKYGSNKFIATKKKSKWLLLIEQFNNPVIMILIAAAVFTSLVGDFKDTIVISVAVMVNTVIGFIQEMRAADALKALKNMAAPKARVIRNGKQLFIATSRVVCGDIIVLESGMKVPADARILESQSLIVDESMLTGESFPVDKKSDAFISESAPLGDRVTMIYSGTIVQKGRGTAIVTDVGPKTELGKISQKVAEAEETESPLQVNISKFGKWLSLAILIIIVIIFIVGFLRGNDPFTMFLTSVGLAVSAIPEGLMVAVTITLSIGVYQMAKKKAVVKKLAAVETLGSTNIICTDKTGTLTKNEMIATKLIIAGEEFDVSGSGYSIEGKVSPVNSEDEISWDGSDALEFASIIGALCTESSITEKNGKWKVTGDHTEAALMIAVKKLGFDDSGWKVNVDIPFESENQLMAVKAMKGEKGLMLVKGAPEEVLARCNKVIDSAGSKSDFVAEDVIKQIMELSDQGLRVLALAYCEKCQNKPVNLDKLHEMTFVGFAGIQDSVRQEAVKAIKDCHDAGVKVVMITGDHVRTARTVASTVGIAADKESPVAIGGVELDKMTDDELYELVPEIDVYARVAPQHKFRIVKQLQRRQNIVAMTGDGVNDAPALKQADIGISMGSGTDVANEASHMVLMDDNFATIVKAIRRGRVILHNLQHILLYILSTSAGGLLTIAMSVAVGLPLPVLPAQLLWINLVTDGTSTFPLAFEKEHGNVMAFAPRKKNAPLITREMVYRIVLAGIVMMLGTLGVFYFTAGLSVSNLFDTAYDDPGLIKARTMAFCVLAFFQIWNVQNSRSSDRSLFFSLPHPKMRDPEFKNERLEKVGPQKNPILLGVMVLAILLQVAAVVFPFMNTILDTVPLSISEWLTVLAVSFSIIIFVEIAKAFISFRNYKKAGKN